MAAHTNEVVPPFDFTAALRLTPELRMQRCVGCVDRVRDRIRGRGLWDVFGVPPVPEAGASEEELQRLEGQLGVALPAEYRTFLRNWRYLVIDDGRKVWGFDHDGVGVEEPWVSDEHRAGVRYLVFGDCWGYADGDQLLFDLSEPREGVAIYLHEHGPLYEGYAPSFSLALWRMVEEWADGV